MKKDEQVIKVFNTFINELNQCCICRREVSLGVKDLSEKCLCYDCYRDYLFGEELEEDIS